MSDKDKVGNRKPPKRTKVKLGQPGNPKDSPSKSKSLAEFIAEELESEFVARGGDHSKKVSKAEAMAKSIVAQAAKGDLEAIQLIRELAPKVFSPVEDDKRVAVENARRKIVESVSAAAKKQRARKAHMRKELREHGAPNETVEAILGPDEDRVSEWRDRMEGELRSHNVPDHLINQVLDAAWPNSKALGPDSSSKDE